MLPRPFKITEKFDLERSMSAVGGTITLAGDGYGNAGFDGRYNADTLTKTNLRSTKP